MLTGWVGARRRFFSGCGRRRKGRGDFCVVVALEATGFFSLTGFLALPARLRWAEMDNEPKNISSKVIFYLSLASLISMTSKQEQM
jgi:hypothetical protein